jgi:hypothetical protein
MLSPRMVAERHSPPPRFGQIQGWGRQIELPEPGATPARAAMPQPNRRRAGGIFRERRRFGQIQGWRREIELPEPTPTPASVQAKGVRQPVEELSGADVKNTIPH